MGSRLERCGIYGVLLEGKYEYASYKAVRGSAECCPVEMDGS